MATIGKFSIDDAFESDEDDKIRMYGSVTESAPLKSSRASSLHEIQLVETGRSKTEESERKLIPSSKRKEKPSWWKHPKIRENWKVVLASFVLLILGIILIVIGIIVEVLHITSVQSFVFFIAGGICIIPGGYHVGYICFAYYGKKGFYFHNLPVLK